MKSVSNGKCHTCRIYRGFFITQSILSNELEQGVRFFPLIGTLTQNYFGKEE